MNTRIIRTSDLYCEDCGVYGHDKMYKLVLIERNVAERGSTVFDMASFHKARKASKWNCMTHQTYSLYGYADDIYTQIYESKIGKGYVDVTALKAGILHYNMELPSLPHPFMDCDAMLRALNFEVKPVEFYECIDDFAERRGFIVGCEYAPISIDESSNRIKLCNDDGKEFILPLSYFKKV